MPVNTQHYHICAQYNDNSTKTWSQNVLNQLRFLQCPALPCNFVWIPSQYYCTMRAPELKEDPFVARCCNRPLNQALSVLSLSIGFECVCCSLGPLSYVPLVCVCMSFVSWLFGSSVLAKWLARKIPLRKPDDFFGLEYCFIVLLCVCLVLRPYMI